MLNYAINYMAHLIELDLYFRRVHPVWWALELVRIQITYRFY